MDSKELIREIAKEKKDIVSDINQCVFSYAEDGYKEFKSSEKIISVLESEGFTVERGVAGIETAFVGVYGSGDPVIGITAEYDALPDLSQEAGCAERKPIEGLKFGHACGHSTLGAGAVGAAIVAKEYLKRTGKKGTVKLFGCPAEETGFGKVFMAREHVFDGIDMAFSWHPDVYNRCFPRTISNFKVRFDFKGIAAHAGAAPEQGRSALDACELMNVGVNYLREHIISDARVHYAYLDCGGEAPNTVQSHASLLYLIRAPRLTEAREILERVKKIAEGAALMTETELEIHVLGGLYDYIPNSVATKLISDSFIEQGGPDFEEEDYAIARRFLEVLPEAERKRIIAEGAQLNGVSEEEYGKRPLNTVFIPYSDEVRKTVMPASTDAGDVSHIAPMGQCNAAIGIIGTGGHTWKFGAQAGTTIGDKAAQAVARAIGYASAKVYEEPSLVEKAKEELYKETGGEYISPLPDDLIPGTGM